MHKVSVLKVESPACFWGRDIQYTEKYKQLLRQINLFYRDLTLDLDTMTPSSLKEGQVCVAYWAEKDLWCRAMVQFLIKDVESLRAACFLVDHGEQLIVSSHRIRVAVHKFLELPFWVKKFQLAGIAPTTLRVTAQEEKAKLVPSPWWDSSATLYLHKLLQVSTQAEAAFVESESECTAVELYLTINNTKVCVNDELVDKKYAYYRTRTTDCVGFPFTLHSSTLTRRTSITTSNRLVRRIPAPPGQLVTPKSPPACGVDGLLAPSPVYSQHEDDTKVKDSEEWFPKRLRIWDDDAATAAAAAAAVTTAATATATAAAASTHRDPSDDSPESAALDKDTSQCRFLKFLHSDNSPQEEDPTVCDTEQPNDLQPEEMAAPDVCAEQEISTHLESGSEEKTHRSEQDLICSEFLEWLNPGPLDSEPDLDTGPADDLLLSMDMKNSGILVHSALQVETCSSLDDAPVTDVLRWVLKKKRYTTLSPTDRYSWPSVARGNNTLIISYTANQPISYLHPLLTHILLASLYTYSSGTGPLAVLLCAGWKKVHEVYELLQESNVGPLLHPVAVLLGLAEEEAKALKIPKNCLLVVTTPFSLVRLLACHCFLFMRVCHLVLDQADQLFAVAPDQMERILEHFQKLTSNEARASSPHQLLAVAKTWTEPMQGLLARHMPQPCIVISVPEETALYGNVQQFIHMTQDSCKLSLLLALLELIPKAGLKTLIVTNSLQELEDVFKALKSRSHFCLKTHEDSPEQFHCVLQQWRTDVGPGTHLILVTTDQCLKYLDISDAMCVFHYGFPSSPRLFGRRILCMAQHFPNLSQVHVESRANVTRSVLLITKQNARCVSGLLRYLVRSGAPLPPELLAFARDVHTAQEDKKKWHPLCSYLKSFGVCRDSSACPNRHSFVPRLDQPQLPTSGVIEVVPLYIKTASVFLGRIIGKTEDDFQRLSSEMALHYAEKKPVASELLEGGLYAVQEEKLFHRVKVLCVQEPGDCLFFRVLVRFVDVGKEVEVRSHQLLQLPERFHSLPAQAMEIVVCRVKPIDAEIDWCPKLTRQISQKIRGLQHQARVVLSIGNTIFVDPMIRLTKLPGLKTCINEYNVQSEILNSKMGESNPNHLDLLKTLCDSSVSSSEADRWPELEEEEEEEEGGVPAKTFTPSEPECLVPMPSVPQLLPAQLPATELPPQLPASKLPPQLPATELPSQLPPIQRLPQFPASKLPLQLPTLEQIPQPPPPQWLPQLPASKLPPQLPTIEQIPQLPVSKLPPQLPTLEQIPQLPPPQLPPQLLHPQLPPQLPTLGQIPQLPPPQLPPQLLHPQLPPQLPTLGQIPQLPPPQLPPQLLHPQLPPPLPTLEQIPQLPPPQLPPLLPACDPNPRPPTPSEAGLEVAQLPNRKSAEITESKWARSGVCPSGWLTVCVTPRHKGVPGAADQIMTRHIISSSESNCDDATRSYHPQVRWYQTSDSVVMTVKLINPEEQSFHFHRQRVVYSGSLSGRSYRADLQLHRPIEEERCSWEMKSNQPVLTLVKQQREHWERLLTSKNIFVSYDLEHIEEDEDESEDGPFLESTPEDFQYAFSSDSDSDSD